MFLLFLKSNKKGYWGFYVQFKKYFKCKNMSTPPWKNSPHPAWATPPWFLKTPQPPRQKPIGKCQKKLELWIHWMLTKLNLFSKSPGYLVQWDTTIAILFRKQPNYSILPQCSKVASRIFTGVVNRSVQSTGVAWMFVFYRWPVHRPLDWSFGRSNSTGVHRSEIYFIHPV